jgi:nitroreductase/NAD-dependent dihydropyrimidine dehydrogenase PreA subunit
MEAGLPRIDPGKCVGCGECATLCPAGVLSVAEGKASLIGTGCIGCGHCAAVCPAEAVALDVGACWAESFATLTPSGQMVAPGAFPPAALVDLLRSRRSCRRFRPDEVPGPVLEDLVRAAVTAPSGTNSQAWTFSVLTSRAAVVPLCDAVADFFRRLNRLAERSAVRRLLALFGRGELSDYYRQHYASVCRALAQWDRDRTDRLFHGATAVVVVGSLPGASCPAEDALLATGNLLLAAQTMGLGTCLIGYAASAMVHDRRVAAAAGLPPEETVHAVVALGWPAVTFLRPTRRRRPLIRYKTA